MDALSPGWNPFFEFDPLPVTVPQRDAFDQSTSIPASKPTSTTSLGIISNDLDIHTPPTAANLLGSLEPFSPTTDPSVPIPIDNLSVDAPIDVSPSVTLQHASPKVPTFLPAYLHTTKPVSRRVSPQPVDLQQNTADTNLCTSPSMPQTLSCDTREPPMAATNRDSVSSLDMSGIPVVKHVVPSCRTRSDSGLDTLRVNISGGPAPSVYSTDRSTVSSVVLNQYCGQSSFAPGSASTLASSMYSSAPLSAFTHRKMASSPLPSTPLNIRLSEEWNARNTVHSVSLGGHQRNPSTATTATHLSIPPMKTLHGCLSMETVVPPCKDTRITVNVSSPRHRDSCDQVGRATLYSSPTVTSLPEVTPSRIGMRESACPESVESTPTLCAASPHHALPDWFDSDKGLEPVPEIEVGMTPPTLSPAEADPQSKVFRISFQELEHQETAKEMRAPIRTMESDEKQLAHDTNESETAYKTSGIEEMSEDALWKTMIASVEVLSTFLTKEQLAAISDASPAVDESSLSAHLNFALNILQVSPNESNVTTAAQQFRNMLKNASKTLDAIPTHEVESISEASSVHAENVPYTLDRDNLLLLQDGARMPCGVLMASNCSSEHSHTLSALSRETSSKASRFAPPPTTALKHPSLSASQSESSVGTLQSPKVPSVKMMPQPKRVRNSLEPRSFRPVRSEQRNLPATTERKNVHVAISKARLGATASSSTTRAASPSYPRRSAPPTSSVSPRTLVPSLRRETAPCVASRQKGDGKAAKARPAQELQKLQTARRQRDDSALSPTGNARVPRHNVESGPLPRRGKASGTAIPPSVRDSTSVTRLRSPSRSFREASAKWALIAPQPDPPIDTEEKAAKNLSKDACRRTVTLSDDRDVGSSSDHDLEALAEMAKRATVLQRKSVGLGYSRKNMPYNRDAGIGSDQSSAAEDDGRTPSTPTSPLRVCASPQRSHHSQSPRKQAEKLLNKAALSALDLENSMPHTAPSRLKPVSNKPGPLAAKAKAYLRPQIRTPAKTVEEIRRTEKSVTLQSKATAACSSSLYVRPGDRSPTLRHRSAKNTQEDVARSQPIRSCVSPRISPRSPCRSPPSSRNLSPQHSARQSPRQCLPASASDSKIQKPARTDYDRTQVTERQLVSSASTVVRPSRDIPDEPSPVSSFDTAPAFLREVLVPKDVRAANDELPSTSHTIRVAEDAELPWTSRTLAVGTAYACSGVASRVWDAAEESTPNVDDATTEQQAVRRKVQEHFSRKNLLQSSFDWYASGSPIGRGSFARIDVALHKLTGELVALKVGECAKESEARAQLQHEAQILTVFQQAGGHLHIVRLFEVIESASSIVLVVEFAQGSDLRQYVTARNGLTEEQSVIYMRQLSAALEFLHSRMMVHGNVSMENLLLFDCKKVVKLADFGAAMKVSEGELCTNYKCALPYSAPEIIRQEPCSPLPVDVWAMGVVLFAMLHGKMPFEGDDMTIKTSIQNVTLGECVRSTSFWALECVLKLLASDAQARPCVMEIRNHSFLARHARLANVEDSTVSLRVNKAGVERTAIRMGIPSDYVSSSLNMPNHVSTTYYLLERARQRKLGPKC